MKTIIKLSSLLAFTALLSACGGGETATNPPAPVEDDSNVYQGPAPQTEDVQNYKVALWDNMATDDKCGACHTNGNQAPYFADQDDVNAAYSASTSLVNLADPDSSRLVEKVAGGHNCWLGSDDACAETMTQWIRLWSDDRVEVTNTIELTAPALRDAGSSKNFPAENTLFADNVYPILTQYCSDCHNESSQFAQSPFFAGDDIDQAYEAAKRVINLDEPSLSRLVVRLGNEFHNCWSNCQSNANDMLSAVTALSDAIPLDEVAEELVLSKALRLTDGVVASSGGRFESDLIAFYEFKTGSGSTAYDTSGIEPAANLAISGNVEWLGSWGIQINSGKAQASTASSKKLHDLITLTGEFSVEAWVTPSNVTQEGPARIVTYSAGDTDRNFTLGQTQYNYDFLMRSEVSSDNGEPGLSTPDADEVLQATLQHVVITKKPFDSRRIYVNGQLIDVNDDELSPISAWDDSYALIVGNEASGNHLWQGSVRLLAIYNRALTPAQVTQNFDVGVGEKFFLLFSISEQVGLANTYVVFEVSQFDNFSYLFNTPSIVNLDGLSLTENLPIEGIRLGLNGKEVPIGQVFSNLEVELPASQPLIEPVELSSLGTIIGIEKGAEQDEFFLTFDQLADQSYVRVSGVVSPSIDALPDTESPELGLRNFAEINASMSVLTGISQANTKVLSTYQLVERQLPSIENIETFISAQQMAVTQLAIAYCDQAVETDSIRNDWFSGIDFSQTPDVALSVTERLQLIDPIIERFVPLDISTQADKSEVSTELSNLVSRLSICPGGCDIERTRTIAKSACTAVLASASTLIQ